MKVKIFPSVATGKVKAPPSKSMAHRAMICAALTEKSTVHGIGASRDVEITLECLKALGAHTQVSGDSITLGGLDPLKIPDGAEIYCHESGSSLRFLIPLCMLGKGRVFISGAPRLMERPLSVYQELAEKLGIEFHLENNTLTVGSGLVAGDYEVSGEVSSQFITGLLFALCTLPEESTLTVTGKFESASYIDMTLSVLRDFGKSVIREDRVFKILPDTSFASREYTVEGDWSGAAFLHAFNLIGGKVETTGLNEDTLQGDAVCLDIYKKMKNGFCSFDLSDCPDLAPILFAMASALNGAEFTGTARLKIKESDRAEAMRQELEKLGAEVTVEENRVIIQKSALHAPTLPISSHNDHRIAMAMAVLLTLTGGEIEGAEAVTKSFPDFWEKLSQIQIGLEIYA
jgi:3-phosphoshikimate 1-carboxyvinyltransferase